MSDETVVVSPSDTASFTVDATPTPTPPPDKPAPDTSLAELKARLDQIEEAAKTRPPSTMEQMAAQIAELEQVQGKAGSVRKEARATADTAEERVGALERQLRTAQFETAASAAGFAQPQFVASALSNLDGDPAVVIGQAVESGAFAMKPSSNGGATPDVSKTKTTGDPGLDELAANIAARRR